MAGSRRRQEEAPGWVWMLFGLGLGLIIALGVYLNRAPTAPLPSPALPAQPLADTLQESAPQSPAAVAATPDAGTTDDSRRFSFYELLPEFEVVIPAAPEAPERTPQPPAVIETPGVYLLQAGSFRTADDADRQRANLALLGIESFIQRVSIEADTFYRVRIGPVEALEQLNDLRSRLAAAGVDSLVMRLADQD